MRLELKQKPQNPIIIQGFPGFGLIGTIATEFLIEHLDAKPIGEFIYDELPPTIAVHQGKLVKPMEVFYAKKQNIIILHTIIAAKGVEWKMTELIVDMIKKLKAKKIICLEGVMSPNGEEVFYYGDEKLKKIARPIQESIVMGVTASVLTRYPKAIALFAESHSQLPDSKAAAKLIEVLDKYLGLKVDTKPLLNQAEEFEKKLKGILAQTSKAATEKERRDLSYLG